MKEHGFQPDWRNSAPQAFSYRSIFKWGAPAAFRHPNQRFYALMKEAFSLSDHDFEARRHEGDEPVVLQPGIPRRLSSDQVQLFENIVGSDNIQCDDYARVKFSSGKTMRKFTSFART